MIGSGEGRIWDGVKARRGTAGVRIGADIIAGAINTIHSTMAPKTTDPPTT